jgi:hypothetical protein
MLACYGVHKDYHNVVVFNTYNILMYHGRFWENSFWWNFVINDGLYPNLLIFCEILCTY